MVAKVFRTMIRIVISDSRQIVIDGLKAILPENEGYLIIGEALDCTELEERCLISQPDLLISNVGSVSSEKLQTFKSIKKSRPKIKILVTTAKADHIIVRKLLKIGIDACLHKDSGKDLFRVAITTVMKDDYYFDDRLNDIIIKSYRVAKTTIQVNTPLSKREKEVICLIADGLSTAEIGKVLFLSELTVETHRRNIYVKLGINKIASLVRYALEEGLVD
ncbi:MAG: LuxR C-terminal-related transcriptional regulator [Crocinitomicaceae bacterium]